MPRLTSDQWQQVQAEYEVYGIANRELARQYNVTEAAIRKKSKIEHWERDSGSRLATQQAHAITELNELKLLLSLTKHPKDMIYAIAFLLVFLLQNGVTVFLVHEVFH